MSNTEKNGNVKMSLFTWVISTLVGLAVVGAGWFAADTKGDLMEIKESQKDLAKQVNEIDKRTSFLEGLTEGQKTTFKTEVNSILSRMFTNNE